MKQAWQFFVKYWKMFLAVLGIVFGAFMLRPGRSKNNGAALDGLKEAEDKIREKRVEEQKHQADSVNTSINDLNNNAPQPETQQSAKERAQKSIDDIAKDYDKL